MLKKLLNRLSAPYIILRDRYVERKLGDLSEENRFSLIYKTGYWKGPGSESLSGEGSSLSATAKIRASLPGALRRHSVRTMLDVPCGDWHWMSKVDLGEVSYIGGDIVDEMVVNNQRKFGVPGRDFRRLDLINDKLPQADLVFVRDCFVHLEFDQILVAIENIIASGSTLFATTTFANVTENRPPVLRDRWRVLDMTLAPFLFPTPVELLDDSSRENPADARKYMGIWRIADLRAFSANRIGPQA